jgi:outer membrane protein assembly factor BamB
MSKHFRLLLLLLLPALSFQLEAQNTWSKRFAGIGTFSSPRVTDLNGDGIMDIIIGAGREEFQSCDSAVMALDGNTGELIWNISATDQIFGSAALKDISGDGVMDIFIGGRSAELICINGRSGDVIWRFTPPKSLKKEWFNFYNPQFIPDQNHDGIEDILISNGGDVLAEPYDPNRPAGQLVIFDSTNGKLISRASMPDGKETYMSVAVLPGQPEGFKNVVYGTGGETIGGNLYVAAISEIMAGDLSGSIKLDSSEKKGFIAPPVWIDINNDGIHDIIANAVDGRLLAFDGKTHQSIWKVSMPNTEAYSSIAVGKFNTDDAPDFFVSYAQGVWPNLSWSRQFMVNGLSGKTEFVDSAGYYQTSTPVVVDLNNDNINEAILSVNYHAYDENGQRTNHSLLAIVDFVEKRLVELNIRNNGHNISSTPWVGDLDQNGLLDIVYCHGTNATETYSFDGMQVNRIDTPVPIDKPIKWGAYMGSDYTGIYNK